MANKKKRATRKEIDEFIQSKIEEGSKYHTRDTLMHWVGGGSALVDVLDVKLLLQEIALSNLPDTTIEWWGHGVTVTDTGCKVSLWPFEYNNPSSTAMSEGIYKPITLLLDIYQDEDGNYISLLSDTPNSLEERNYGHRYTIEKVILVLYAINEAVKVYGKEMVAKKADLGLNLLENNPTDAFSLNLTSMVRPTSTIKTWIGPSGSAGHIGICQTYE